MGAQFQHDHIVHFYHLHALDWVDIVSALKADPKKTAALSDNVSNAPGAEVSILRMYSSGFRPLSTAASSVRLPMPTGVIRPTSCRRKPT